MALDPEIDVMTALTAAMQLPAPPIGALQLTSTVDLFKGPLRDDIGGTIPPQCVFVHCPDGAEPEPFLDGGVKSTFRAFVNVIVRSNVEKYGDGQAIARACLRILHLTPLGYTSCVAQVSEPIYDQWRATGSHVWRIPFLLTWVEDVALP